MRGVRDMFVESLWGLSGAVCTDVTSRHLPFPLVTLFLGFCGFSFVLCRLHGYIQYTIINTVAG